MDYSQDCDAFTADLIEHPIAVKKPLPHFRAAKFRHLTSSHGLLADGVALCEQRANDSSGVMRRVTGNESRDGIDIVECLVGPDQLASHCPRISCAWAVVRVRPDARSARPRLIFSST